jgi:hypothetical protein
VAVYERASVTVVIAQSTLRSRSSRMPRSRASVSCITFSPSAPSMSSPSPVIGVAAPMLVPGAISATWPAMVMNVPALAARAPGGATQTIVGSGASSSV